MKVLFCHNYYRFPGGEDRSFESEVAMLRGEGHEVITLVRRNESLESRFPGLLRMSARTFHSRGAKSAIRTLIAEHEPDVLHCNNLFPQISTSVYTPARAAGIPIVQSIRNYRSFCANAFFYRDEKVCTDCLQKRASFSSIRHGCYRGSHAASTVVTAMQLWQRSLERLRPSVTLFVTPSEFSRQTHISGGFAPDRILVKPNFVDPDPGPGRGSSGGFLFAGRLSPEKGVKTIIDAWKKLDLPLAIYGDGPLKDEVVAFANSHPRVQYFGHQPLDAIIDAMGSVKAVLMPSLWYETFGRTIAESFSRGTPVVASRLGAMAELVEDGVNGLLVEPGQPDDLVHAVNQLEQLASDPYRQMRENARRSYQLKYSKTENYRRLMEIYQFAIDLAKKHSPVALRVAGPRTSVKPQ